LPDTTGKVRLRRTSANDAELVSRWRSEPSARRYQPLRELPFNELRKQLQARGVNEISPSAEGEFQWIIETPDGDAGWINLTMVSREHSIATIGYTIGEEFRDKGYATSAIKKLQRIAFARDELDLDRLEAVAAVENVASRKALERAGFQLEGIARAYLIVNGDRLDHARYGLLRTDVERDQS
jgi:[ribosomal protein S5]-alanine N-acetyltransferase